MKTETHSLPAIKFGLLLATLGFLISGCETRSISNSGYQSGSYYGGNSLYRGELNEFDVLGVERTQDISEQEIGHALDNAEHVMIKKGSSILLIQSGAGFPDEPMITELNKHFTVTPFSGVPEREPLRATGSTEASYSKSLRLAAARGGNATIVCYWGILESAREGLATKPVSWVPIVGWAIPDETQHMRIRINAAIIDVRTGNWPLYRTEPIEEKAASGTYNRGSSDQRRYWSSRTRLTPRWRMIW